MNYYVCINAKIHANWVEERELVGLQSGFSESMYAAKVMQLRLQAGGYLMLAALNARTCDE